MQNDIAIEDTHVVACLMSENIHYKSYFQDKKTKKLIFVFEHNPTTQNMIDCYYNSSLMVNASQTFYALKKIRSFIKGVRFNLE